MVHKFFTRFPIETWIIGIPSLLILFFTILGTWHTHIQTGTFVNNIIFSLVGERFLESGLIFVYLYVYIRLIYVVAKKIQQKESWHLIWIEAFKFLRSVLFWICIITIGTFAFSHTLAIIFQTSSLSHIAYASHVLFSVDLSLFKTYPANAFNVFFASHAFLGYICLISYMILSFVVSATLIILMCANTKNFRRFLISFMVTGYIGLIFWYFIPATSPRGYIDINVTQSDTAIIEPYKATLAPITIPFIEKTDKTWIDPTNISFNVSTFPSMHATWAMLVLLSLIIFYRRFAIILIPWCIALCIGAIAIYEHYVVDIFAGILLAGLVFWIVNKLLDREKTYFKDSYSLMYIWELLQSDVKLIQKFFFWTCK
ncbi:MAG: phosphatase PAP2 family protein [bacterium]